MVKFLATRNPSRRKMDSPLLISLSPRAAAETTDGLETLVTMLIFSGYASGTQSLSPVTRCRSLWSDSV